MVGLTVAPKAVLSVVLLVVQTVARMEYLSVAPLDVQMVDSLVETSAEMMAVQWAV